jgi:membrane protein YqaA with SNARE-associated domain
MIDAREAALRREAKVATVRFLVGCVLFLGALALVSTIFHDDLERAGRWFVERFGAAGMTLGAFLADGVHFPLPPQFYLLAGVAGGFSRTVALLSVIVGSALGGLLAFAIGRRGSGVRFFRDRVRGPRVLVESLVARHGYWGLGIAGLLPISYWVLCSMAGLLRMPYRAYGVLALMRVPRLLLSYAIIVLAWGSSVR